MLVRTPSLSSVLVCSIRSGKKAFSSVLNKPCGVIGLVFALLNGKCLVSVALGICSSLAALQAQLLPACSEEPSASHPPAQRGLSAHPSLGMDWICQCLQITDRLKDPGPCTAAQEHHIPLGQECNEGSLESLPFHCHGKRRELTVEKPSGLAWESHSNPLPISTLGF